MRAGTSYCWGLRERDLQGCILLGVDHGTVFIRPFDCLLLSSLRAVPISRDQCSSHKTRSYTVGHVIEFIEKSFLNEQLTSSALSSHLE